MSAVSLENLAKDVRDLPALPSVVLELINSFGQQDVDIATLADKISRDQALAAKTLRLANSSFYGLSSKVKTVNQAIVVLGFDSVRALVAAGGIVEHFNGASAAQDTTAFWRHSIATALCAKHLARATGQNPDHAFIAALLHDIGELVMATRFPELYARARARAEQEGIEQLQAEQAEFGFDHLRVGLVLAQAWKFPGMIQGAIEHHHAPRREDVKGLAGLVHAADAIVSALDLATVEGARVPHLQDDVWDALGLDGAQLQGVFRDTEMQYEEACQILAA